MHFAAPVRRTSKAGGTVSVNRSEVLRGLTVERDRAVFSHSPVTAVLLLRPITAAVTINLAL
jgi:hypothetical protein